MIKNEFFTKIVIVIAIIGAISTSFCVIFFSQGKFMDIPKGTQEGAIITGVGSLCIVIINTALAWVVILFFKKRLANK